MRWKYLIPRIVIVSLVWSFFFWAFDPILRWSMTKTGERINGAKVDVAGLNTTFFPPALELANVQIADRGQPGRNLVEFESFRVKLASGPLAHRKLVIEEGTITGMTWNTPRADSGILESATDLQFESPIHLDELRDQVAELGKAWLNEAAGAAKSQLDPKTLETVKVSTALKDQWLMRFQMYETKLKDIETRVKNLKDLKPEGNTLQKIEGYRQAAIEVQTLIAEARQMRQELSQLGPTAVADLQKIEAAKQRDLQNIQQKLEILKLDKDAISEALLGPELVAALEESLDWVKWTKDKVGHLTAVKEPARSRGEDVLFPKPDDPHPGFLMRKLLISGTARRNGKLLPYAAKIENITSDPQRWGKPILVDVQTEGTAKTHLTATIDRTTDRPRYEVTVEQVSPQPATATWGDAEKLAFHISSEQTKWNANLKLVGDEFSGQVAFRQENVRIQPHPAEVSSESESATIAPVKFEWDPQQELHRALAGVFGGVTELEATVELAGTLENPRWSFSSNLGPQVAAGVENYLATEMARRQTQLLGEMERVAGEEIAGFRGLLTEKFRNSSGRLNIAETEANQLVQKFANQPLDVRGLFRR